MQRTARENGNIGNVVYTEGNMEGVVVATNRIRAHNSALTGPVQSILLDGSNNTASKIERDIRAVEKDRVVADAPQLDYDEYRENLMANMSEEERAKYESKLEGYQGAASTQLDREAKQQQAETLKRIRAKKASKDRTTVNHSGGFKVTNFVGAPVMDDIQDLSGGGEYAPMVETVETGGMKFTTTNGPGSLGKAQKNRAKTQRALRRSNVKLCNVAADNLNR